jgi:uncharacterized protein YegL
MAELIKNKKNEITDITLLLDKSGSMQYLYKDTVGSVKSFIEQQKQVEGEANLTLITFSSSELYNVEFSCDIKKCPELEYSINGGTALLDAIGKTIEDTIKRIDGLKIKPDKVILAILTDGEENQSKEYKLEAIKKMIETQESKEKWEVIYLGANQNAIKVAENMGIKFEKSITYGANSIGTTSAMRSFSAKTSEYRTSNVMSFSQEDRIDQLKAGVTLDLNKKD